MNSPGGTLHSPLRCIVCGRVISDWSDIGVQLLAQTFDPWPTEAGKSVIAACHGDCGSALLVDLAALVEEYKGK